MKISLNIVGAMSAHIRRQAQKFPAIVLRPLLTTTLVGTIFFTGCQMATAKESTSGFQGVEFFGSSLITRTELDKQLGLRPGANAEQIQRAIKRFREKLSQQHISANVDMASDEGGKYFVTVDVLETGVAGNPTRKLNFPHHIILSSEVPYMVFTELLARREQLSMEGRAVTESFDEAGMKRYSDEPCNRFADKLHRLVPDMQREFLNVINSDPDQDRRSKAIEVLNWTSDPVLLCTTLIPTIDDASEQVRTSADRFIAPRVKFLPPDYPFIELIEGFARQLSRPSHQDRMLALRSLLETAKTHPETIEIINEFAGERLKQLQQDSVISAVKRPAAQLLAICAQAGSNATKR